MQIQFNRERATFQQTELEQMDICMAEKKETEIYNLELKKITQNGS